MIPSRFRLAAALLAAAGVLVATAACHAQAPQPVESAADLAFGQKVRAYLLNHPEVLQEAFERLQSKMDAEKLQGSRAAIAARSGLLDHDPRDGVLGNPDGRVTVVEFFDYRCPFCKAAEPEVERLLAANPDVRLVLKQLPILDAEDQTHISEDASRAAIAARAQGRLAPVHRALLATKQLDEDGIRAAMKSAGVDPAAAVKVEAAPATTASITDTRALASALGIDGTPAFVVGDQLILGAQMDALRAAVAAARKAAPAKRP